MAAVSPACLLVPVSSSSPRLVIRRSDTHQEGDPNKGKKKRKQETHRPSTNDQSRAAASLFFTAHDETAERFHKTPALPRSAMPAHLSARPFSHTHLPAVRAAYPPLTTARACEDISPLLLRSTIWNQPRSLKLHIHPIFLQNSPSPIRPLLSDLQVEAGDASQDHHGGAEDHVRAELEEPEGRLADAHLQRHHGPQVEHTQSRPCADGEGVLVVRVEPVVKRPVCVERSGQRRGGEKKGTSTSSTKHIEEDRPPSRCSSES